MSVHQRLIFGYGSGGGGGGSDPYASNVVLLLNGEGGTIVDSSSYARSYSTAGGVVTSSAQAKFGTKSLVRPSGQVLRYASSSDFDLRTSDFTIEFYRYVTASNYNTYQVARANGASSGRWALGERYSGSGDILAWYFNGSAIFQSGTLTTYNVWQHCAYSRASGTGYLCLDGSVVATGSDGIDYSDTTSDLSIFGDQTSASLTDAGVHLDFVRVTVGVGRYTGSYTPPTP